MAAKAALELASSVGVPSLSAASGEMFAHCSPAGAPTAGQPVGDGEYKAANTYNGADAVSESKKRHLVDMLSSANEMHRKLVALRSELRTRTEDAKAAHLLRASSLQQKAVALSQSRASIELATENKDWLVARLQEPFAANSIAVETASQADFAELLQRASQEQHARQLSTVDKDISWIRDFSHSPQVWEAMLKPVQAALASSTRRHEALMSMRKTMAELHSKRITQQKPEIMRAEDVP
eukprot:jgi/Chlat1/5987/Chrsp4S06302